MGCVKLASELRLQMCGRLLWWAIALSEKSYHVAFIPIVHMCDDIYVDARNVILLQLA